MLSISKKIRQIKKTDDISSILKFQSNIFFLFSMNKSFLEKFSTDYTRLDFGLILVFDG